MHKDSNRGRAKKKDPQTTVSHAQAGSLSSPPCSSPTNNRRLPPRDQNKHTPEVVSIPTSLTDKQINTQQSPEPVLISQSSAKASGVINQILDYQSNTHPLAPTGKMGDNRATLPPGDTPPREENAFTSTNSTDLQDLLKSSPDDPWHLAFTELREMRAGMTTIDRLEKVTMEIALQLKTITDRTSTMETTVSQNNFHIKGIDRDVAGLKKEVEKQQKECQLNFKDFKDIKKEVLQCKDMGKDLSGLRKEVEKCHKDSQFHSKEVKDIKKEVSQVREMAKNLSGLQKEIEKKHKAGQHNSKELKEVRKDFLQLKDMGKDLAGLGKMDKQCRDGQLVSKELKEVKKEVAHIKEVEQSVSSIRKELEKVSSNQNNDNVVKEMQKEIKSLRQTVEKQQDTIQNLHKIKDDFTKTSHKTVGEMNKLIQAQKEQVHEFKNIRTNFHQESQNQKDLLDNLKSTNQEMQKDTQQQFQRISEDLAYKKLKDQAFNNRNNVVIIGLPEHATNNAYSVATTFFRTTLKIRKRLEVETAYRIGQTPPEGSHYIRPLVVKFAKQPDRNLIWRQRNYIPQVEGNQRIRIQADLPKQLRDDISTLYRVARATSSMEEFQAATVRDFALVFNGRSYSAGQLEQLPFPLRPSSLAVRKSDDVLAFFSKFCVLSNHFPSSFKIQDKMFHSMEHYLAFERAKISEQDHLIEKAWQAKDPVESKSILNLLRTDHVQEWQDQRADIALTGLRAKFQQNQHMYEFLRDTEACRLGEASRDPVWGVGMTLEDEHILDTAKWTQSGNLLGNLLMQLRTELAADK